MVAPIGANERLFLGVKQTWFGFILGFWSVPVLALSGQTHSTVASPLLDNSGQRWRLAPSRFVGF